MLDLYLLSRIFQKEFFYCLRLIFCRDKSEIDLKHFVAYLWQISNAMSFIAACRMAHRDLAARNILLFGENKAKVGIKGLAVRL
jgi:serine/threonine protein kinase